MTVTAIPPSIVFGGPDRRFLPNVVIDTNVNGASAGGHASGPRWWPIDVTVNNATWGPLYVPPHVARVVYVSRNLYVARVLTLTWDTPDVVYVLGGAFPPGWHECRRVTAELIAEVEGRARDMDSRGRAAGGAAELDVVAALARVRYLVNAWHESREGSP